MSLYSLRELNNYSAPRACSSTGWHLLKVQKFKSSHPQLSNYQQKKIQVTSSIENQNKITNLISFH